MDSPDDTDSFLMRVKSSTDVRKLASALYHNMQQHKKVILRTLGAGPTQQAMKAAAIVNGRLATEGKDLLIRPCLHDVDVGEGQVLTALSFICTVHTL